MNDFDYDALQKKRVAASARRRKSGSRSRRVSLPSDHLTQKELKAMCGEVQSYDMASPIQWSAFLTWPRDLQQEYIFKLQADYGATGEMLAECFATSHATVIRGLEESGIRLVPQPRRISREAALERVRRWRGFLYGGDGEPTTGEPTGDTTGETTGEATVKTTEEEEPTEAVKEQTSPDSPPAEQVVPSLLSLTEVSYTLKGLDTGSLVALLSTLPLPRAPFTVTLTVTAEPLRAGVEAG